MFLRVKHIILAIYLKIYPPQTNWTYLFLKILPKFEFEVNSSVKSYASLTCEGPAHLKITYHSVYYLKYTELKSILGTKFGHHDRYTGF